MNLGKRLVNNRKAINLLIVLFIFAISYPAIRKSEKETLRYRTQEFFNNIINEQYDDAFDFVDYGGYSGKKPNISDESKKARWINQMRRQRASGIHIEACKAVKVDNVDYPEATAILLVNIKGRLEEYKVGVHYIRFKNNYKIRDISRIDDIIQKTICGRVEE